MAEIGCRWFNGYKPCGRSNVCDVTCSVRNVPTVRILIVHLEALGAVVRSTSLLAAIKRKYPTSHITWATFAPAHHLLKNIPSIDRILNVAGADCLELRALEFDVGFCIDKSLKAVGVMNSAAAIDQWFGFKADSQSGSIIPATPAAEELWSLGLSNHKKFFINTKPETQLIAEALELSYERDEYIVALDENEKRVARERRQLWRSRSTSFVIGINTGCSGVIPYKKLSIEAHRKLIQELLTTGHSIVLLGGPEDTERNIAIGRGLDVYQSPTQNGLRDGLSSIEACDLVITGDSLGMHMSIALKKWVVAWFGPTCAHEIDLFGRGEKIFSAVSCGPCWKRTCDHAVMCYDQVPQEDLISAVRSGIAQINAHEQRKELNQNELSEGTQL